MAEYQPLHFLHAVVESELAMDVALGLGMVTQGTQAPRDGGISGDDEPCLASRTEILGRIEAVATAQAERTNATPVETCADGLRRILDHNQPMPRSKCHDARHVGRLSIKMDRNDRLHCSIKPLFGVGKVDIRALLLYVAEDGRCSDIKHRPGRGDKSIGWDQHLIPWTDAGDNQGKMQSRGTGVDADRMCDTEIVGGGLLKLCDERAEGERTILEQTVDIGQGLALDLPPLSREIGERNG